MDSDGTSSYRSAMWDENSVYSKLETGFAFKPYMNDVYVESFNNQTFKEKCDGNTFWIIKHSNPLNSLFQHVPVTEKVKSIEVNPIRTGWIIDILTSVDF